MGLYEPRLRKVRPKFCQLLFEQQLVKLQQQRCVEVTGLYDHLNHGLGDVVEYVPGARADQLGERLAERLFGQVRADFLLLLQ